MVVHMTSTATAALPVRPLPPNTVVSIAGVSFRQDVVRTVVEHDEVRIRHDHTNEYDPHACAVTTLDGRQLGFIPQALAPRLSLPHPAGVWRARVEEVLRGETWGLRVLVGPLVENVGRDVGLRHRGDGLVESPTGEVSLMHPETPEVAADGQCGDPKRVFARSGRLLGSLIAVDGSRVRVHTARGTTATYPLAVVDVRGAA